MSASDIAKLAGEIALEFVRERKVESEHARQRVAEEAADLAVRVYSETAKAIGATHV